MSMATAVHVSLAEYMNTDYEPDCDYVDGIIEERNVGKKRHSKAQGLLYAWLLSKTQEHGCDVLLEQRVQISPSRVRIPDICLAVRNSDEVVQQPPALCIEILSPEDRWSRIQVRLNDYLAFGVQTIWIIDPYSKEAWIATPEKPATAVEHGKLRCTNPDLEVELKEILPED